MHKLNTEGKASMSASRGQPVWQWARLQCPLRPAALPLAVPASAPHAGPPPSPQGTTPSSGPTRFFPVDSARLPPGQGSVPLPARPSWTTCQQEAPRGGSEITCPACSQGVTPSPSLLPSGRDTGGLNHGSPVPGRAVKGLRRCPAVIPGTLHARTSYL